MTITHRFSSAKADGADATLVRPSNWNDTHSITDVNPEADASYVVGTASLRFKAVHAQTFNVEGTLGDANPTLQIGNQFVAWGAGGSTATSIEITSDAFFVSTSNQNLTILPLGANQSAAMRIKPSGTSTIARFSIQRLNSDSNTEYLQIGSDIVGTGFIFYPSIAGTGVYRPVIFYNSAAEAFRVTPSPVLQLSSSLSYHITSVSANTTLLAGTHQAVLVNATGGAVTITLPAANAQTGLHIVVIKIDSSANAVTVQRAGADNIEGVISLSLATQYKKTQLVSDGISTWYDLDAGLV